jgi:hypothetical protein
MCSTILYLSSNSKVVALQKPHSTVTLVLMDLPLFGCMALLCLLSVDGNMISKVDATTGFIHALVEFKLPNARSEGLIATDEGHVYYTDDVGNLNIYNSTTQNHTSIYVLDNSVPVGNCLRLQLYLGGSCHSPVYPIRPSRPPKNEVHKKR